MRFWFYAEERRRRFESLRGIAFPNYCSFFILLIASCRSAGYDDNQVKPITRLEKRERKSA